MTISSNSSRNIAPPAKTLMATKSKLRKYVLTGGTSVGKTTIIDMLAKLGHPTFPEFSRIIINKELKKELKKDDGVLPWTKLALFQDMYAREQVKEEIDIEKYMHGKHAKKPRIQKDYIFMDRCIVDGVAFCQHAQVAIPEEIDSHIKMLRADKQDYVLIFILGPLEQYHFDEGRVMKPEESLSIQILLEKAYANYGYELIPVPFMPPEERVKFILGKVEEFEDSNI
jgi:predicted ATPase